MLMLIALAGEEAKFCAQLEALLASEGHRVGVALKPRLLEWLRRELPQLLVLAKPSLPESGPFLRALREEQGLRPMPVLCVIPGSAAAEAVACLDAGADDVLERPFNPQIFLARVRTLLRRRIWSGGLEEDGVASLHCGPVSMRLLSRQVTLAGRPLALTRLEFDLLAHLIRHADRVFRRQELLEAVWNYPAQVETRTLDKHIETLRRKLAQCGRFIETVHGVGYRLAPPPSTPSPH